MDIRRFGPGHRRSDGPQGTQGVEGAVIHHDEKSLVSELAFGRFAMVAPHANPNTSLFVVISGGGYVQVGDERTRVNHGEAVLWPANVLHGAYTDGSEMRAIVIEVPSADSPVLAGEAATILAARAQTGHCRRIEETRRGQTGRTAEAALGLRLVRRRALVDQPTRRSIARGRRKTRTDSSTRKAATTRIAAAAIEALRSPAWNSP